MIRFVPATLLALALALSARAEIAIQTVTSPGGITAWLYEEHALPIVNLAASFLAALDVAALRAARERTLVRDRLRIAVVGDITAAELGPLLDRIFGDLPATGPPLPPVAVPKTPGTVRVIDFAIPQSIVLLGQAGIARADPDFIPAVVMDHVLGSGGFGSRLMREVRDERGLTYGIGTWLDPGDFGWLYMGSFSSANARAAEALDIVRAEWRRMAEEGATAEELEAAKRFLSGAYPLRFDGNGQIAGELVGQQVAGLDPGYVNRRNALVEAVTVEDVARVARRLLQPDALTVVIVGQPEEVEGTN